MKIKVTKRYFYEKVKDQLNHAVNHELSTECYLRLGTQLRSMEEMVVMSEVLITIKAPAIYTVW